MRGFEGCSFPLVVAHRGASATHPENTLPAFEAALAAGADAVELDVRLAADGTPVVLHDPDVARTTDGRGPVAALTVAELKRLNAGPPGGPPVQVPTLREVLELVSGRAGVDLEVKNLPGEPGFREDGRGIVEATLEALEETAFAGPVLVSSFHRPTLRRARRLAPEVPTGLLLAAGDLQAALTAAVEDGHAFLLPGVALVEAGGDAFLARAHRVGLRVGTWTVDDPEAVADLFARGVDAVATNDPAAAVAVKASL